ncbi:hypothetical protein ISS86_02420 [Candidatus Microgenomates bacterium]|nr:hypothetical protein [Candidatus Microgenomates bacterium]
MYNFLSDSKKKNITALIMFREVRIEHLHCDSGFVSVSAPTTLNPSPEGLGGIARFTRETVTRCHAEHDQRQGFMTQPIMIDFSLEVSPFPDRINVRIDHEKRQVYLDIPEGAAEKSVGQAPLISVYRTAAIAASLVEAQGRNLPMSDQQQEAVLLHATKVTEGLIKELDRQYDLNSAVEGLDPQLKPTRSFPDSIFRW